MPSSDDLYHNTDAPSLLWRSASYQTILAVSALSRGFLSLLSKTEVHGLPRFLELLRSRSDYTTRRRGLVTVSNHLSVIDDPLIWGVLPLSFAAYHGYRNHRWTLGSHDICFKNAFAAHFFTLGQTLPTHRLAHSPHGGPNQATMTEAVRLLSRIDAQRVSLAPFNNPRFHHETARSSSSHWPTDCVDPFSDIRPTPMYPSAPNDNRFYLAPSRYACNSYSWVHIFPEGFIHQTEDNTMRYLKWGVSRLILEPPECPDVVPIFIEGTDKIMHESRSFPRFLPRVGKRVSVTFGERVDTDAVFGDLRRRWKRLADEDLKARGEEGYEDLHLGLLSERLKQHPEALAIRKECTLRVREQILKLRRSRGYPDEDPKAGRLKTLEEEGPKREGQMDDGSWVKET